jgi:hypothetical protein
MIKWYDALDSLTDMWGRRDVVKGLQMARECQHPDAVWLASLFPAAAEVTQQRMCDLMLQQGEDSRALWLTWASGARRRDDVELLRRAAERGYAPAELSLAAFTAVDAKLSACRCSNFQPLRTTATRCSTWGTCGSARRTAERRRLSSSEEPQS